MRLARHEQVNYNSIQIKSDYSLNCSPLNPVTTKYRGWRITPRVLGF